MTVTSVAGGAAAGAGVATGDGKCGDWDTYETESFILYNNLWGKSSAGPGGKQCISLTSSSTSSIDFTAAWSWGNTNPGNVKSYPNVFWKAGSAKVSQTGIDKLPSIPSTFDWSYTGTAIDADVAYDLFVGGSPGISEQGESYEVMIWLGRLGGAAPIGAGSAGKQVKVDDVSWSLYTGSNGAQKVASFVSQEEQQKSFTGDLALFIKALIDQKDFFTEDPSKLYLKHIAAGTEPFMGDNAVFQAKLTFG
ncbi:hypothetical protein PYCC9005_004745 [Savitreella phatthalungensis]